MTTLLKPSTLIPKGLRVQQINNLTLFKFTDELGDRLQALLSGARAIITCKLAKIFDTHESAANSGTQ